MNSIIKRLANLLAIKSIVTIMLTIAFVYLSTSSEVTKEFMTIYASVIGYYFGTQKTKEE